MSCPHHLREKLANLGVGAWYYAAVQRLQKKLTIDFQRNSNYPNATGPPQNPSLSIVGEECS